MGASRIAIAGSLAAAGIAGACYKNVDATAQMQTAAAGAVVAATAELNCVVDRLPTNGERLTVSVSAGSYAIGVEAVLCTSSNDPAYREQRLAIEFANPEIAPMPVDYQPDTLRVTFPTKTLNQDLPDFIRQIENVRTAQDVLQAPESLDRVVDAPTLISRLREANQRLANSERWSYAFGFSGMLVALGGFGVEILGRRRQAVIRNREVLARNTLPEQTSELATQIAAFESQFPKTSGDAD